MNAPSRKGSWLLVALLAALLAACDHGAPFRPVKYSPDGPFNPLPPIRLTLNPGTDLAPRWLETGEILYSAQRLDRGDEDRCLAVLPGGGGAIERYICRSTGTDDSTNVFEEVALSRDGRIAYVRAATHRLPIRPITPDEEALVVAPLDHPNDARVLRPLDYTAPSQNTHQGIAYVNWLSSTRIVYIGQTVEYPRGCSSCAPDTVATGIEVVALDFSTSPPVLDIVPGTAGASSVTVGANGDTIYFTRYGDSRVYRHTFSNGQQEVVHDFVAAGIAGDVVVQGGRMIVVSGGDNGGPLHVVTLATGAEVVVGDATSRFRRPAISPDGTRVAVESRNPDGTADLWLLTVP